MNYDKFSNILFTFAFTLTFFNSTAKSSTAYVSIKSSNENPEFPAFFAFDNDKKTFWQNRSEKKDDLVFELELDKPRYIVGCTITGSDFIGRLEVFISDNKNNFGNAVILTTGKINGNIEAKRWDNGLTIQKGKKGKYIRIVLKPEKNEIVRINTISWQYGD